MMRINRQEENFIGRARPGIVMRGSGSATAVMAVSRPLDMFSVQDGGPYGRSGDFMSAGDHGVADVYTAANISVFADLSVYTNTPPRSAQRAPGGVQVVAMMSSRLMQKAAKQLGDRPAGPDEDQCAPSGSTDLW